VGAFLCYDIVVTNDGDSNEDGR